MKTLDDLNFYNKKVLLRTDLNSDVVNGKVLYSERIREALHTIVELKKRGAKVIVIAHQGRPYKNDFISLKQHAKLLNKYVKIKFIKDIFGKKAVKAIENLKVREVILLENIRFEKDEFKPEKINNKFIENLVPLIDIYVNDAFSVCHRNHTSIVSFPKYLPSCAGRALEKEIDKIKKIKLKKSLFILGGAKPEDNIKLLKADKILACGLFAQMCLIAAGFKFGAQEKYLKKEIKDFDKIKGILKRKLKNIETPIDFAVKIKGKREELCLEEFPNEHEIFDIGTKTIAHYINEIKSSKSIFMKGPAGFCEDRKFCKGTYAILKAISKNKGFSLIGGGNLNDAIRSSRINKKKFSYISLSGGALIAYVSGERLPGLEALNGL